MGFYVPSSRIRSAHLAPHPDSILTMHINPYFVCEIADAAIAYLAFGHKMVSMRFNTKLES